MDNNNVVEVERFLQEKGVSLLDGSGGLVATTGDVWHFHKACGIPALYPDELETLKPERIELRWSLIDEEVNRELRVALINGDVPKIADSIIDSIYVLIGLAIEMGIPLGPLWKEVHAANMRKTTGPKREDGKQLKPDGWVGPDIEGVLRKYSNWDSNKEVVSLTTDATGKGL